MQEDTASVRTAAHAACNEFVAACSSFRGRHSSLDQELAAAEAQTRSLSISQKISEARAALASAEGRLIRTQGQLGATIDASKGIGAHCEGESNA